MWWCLNRWNKRTLKIRLGEHKSTVKRGDLKNDIVVHVHETKHASIWESSGVAPHLSVVRPVTNTFSNLINITSWFQNEYVCFPKEMALHIPIYVIQAVCRADKIVKWNRDEVFVSIACKILLPLPFYRAYDGQFKQVEWRHMQQWPLHQVACMVA